MLISLDADAYTKTLGIAWNATSDHFRITAAQLPTLENLTIAKTFGVLDWFSPSFVKAKILLQRCWEQKLDWDDPVPSSILYSGDLNFTCLQKGISHGAT